ncbi:MAG: hypothetical protein HN374_01360 [Cryomorphaceae bacterium]|jgi:hypothetical protein|nr:hypothetical protein [Cryomorphaceae bacterium]
MNFNFFYSFLNNRKGQGLSIETIIKILIVMIAALILIVIFSGQSNVIFDSVNQFLGIASEGVPSNLTVGDS